MSKELETKIEEFLTRGVAEVIDREHLKKRLLSGEKLRVKYGADPTRPDLHLGHAVGMRKLKMLQDLGHKIIFIIGDFTAEIGDPSGQSKTRPILTDEEIEQNTKTYLNQVGKILDASQIEIRKNSEWFSKMNPREFIKLASKFTHARTIEREDFQRRMKAGVDIGLHELMYPLMQAYDSVVIEADLEVAGNDQKFNVLAGRELQKKMGKSQQDILLVPLLVGLDGHEKMSKSLDNYIGITEELNQMFGKIMSIPDNLIINYFELCTDTPIEQVKKMKADMESGKLNPRDAKLCLAFEIVSVYHGENEAKEAQKYFIDIFSNREIPTEIPEFTVEKESIKITEFLVISGNAKSVSDARRKIEQGGVEIDGIRVEDWKMVLNSRYDNSTLKIGKHQFARVKFEK